MRLRLGAFARYRPRVLTVVVFFAIAASMVIANLNVVDDHANPPNIVYGWPLIWHWHVIVFVPPFNGQVGSWQYSGAALAANAALWLLILVAACGACEWLLRRHPLRFHWSLKTMLAAIGIIGAICGWFAAARNRARIQDEIISLAIKNHGTVYVERWGPRWLDVVGADRFRRRIIGLDFKFDDAESARDFERITDLLDLRQLRILEFYFQFYYAPGELRDEGAERRTISSVLATVGDLTQLEELALEGPMLMSDRLDCLARLTNLKFLTLSICDPEGDESGDGGRSSLSHLPVLAQLEALKLGGESVGDTDLSCLAILPRLKSLDLDGGFLTDAGLAELATLDLLEELEIYNSMVSPAGLESLGRLKRLKTLHIDSTGTIMGRVGELPLDHGDVAAVNEKDVAKLTRALSALRQRCPGITVDAKGDELYRRHCRGKELPDRMTFPFLPQWLTFQQ